jgi:hypothetical protein
MAWGFTPSNDGSPGGGQTAGSAPAQMATAREAVTTPEPEPPADQDRPMGTVTTDIRDSQGARPRDEALRRLTAEGKTIPIPLADRDWASTCYRWDAPGLYYRPLYFEERNLERYGYSARYARLVQPALSGAHFFGTAIILPLKMVAEPPWERIYAPGH